MTGFELEDSSYFTGPDLTDEMVTAAEESLGYRLPASYIDLLRVRNGVVPKQKCLRTSFVTYLAPGFFEVDAILGIGGAWGIDVGEPPSSQYMIKEWDYPDMGVVSCATPASGYDAVMLDYRVQGAEPAVAYIDEDRVPRVVASSFSDFIARLETIKLPELD